MRAMVVSRYGPPEVFESREWPEPQLQPGDVLLRVHWAGINFADLLARMGLYGGTPKAPFVPGLEVSGIVEKIAPTPETTALGIREGDRVAALTMFRGYAEKVVVPARQVFALPAQVSLEEGAAIPVNYLTAFHSLFEMGNLRAGDRALIHGAAGGVGIAAVQLCKARGIAVFGTAGTAKQEYLRSIGVDHPIDYSRQDFLAEVRRHAPDGIELALDAVGGDSFTRSRKCLGPCGRLIVYGFSAAIGPSGRRNPWLALRAFLSTEWHFPLRLIDRNLAVIGVHIGRMRGREAVLRREMQEILAMYLSGAVRPVIGKTFPLVEAAAAHRFIHQRQNIGKVLLQVT